MSLFNGIFNNKKLIANDLLIGFTLAVVVLPQAIAFSTTLAGVPPYFGIYAAIWGVLFTALLNNSRIFHGGPNSTLSAVMGVTLLPIAPQFGESYMGYALTLILMAGIIQLLFYAIKPLAKLLDLMSEAVINGMIFGIGLFLILKSITAFAGFPVNTEVEWPLVIAWHNLLALIEIGNLHAIEIGLVTLISAIIIRSIKPIRNWGILISIIAGTLYSEYLNSKYGLHNTLIEQTADFSAIRFVFPSIPLFTQEALPDIITIMPGAVTLAMLGLFQTVAAMRRMNRIQGQHIESREGIKADGISNCALPFLSSLPTCASFNRMWLMHSMGSRTRLVAVSSAFFLLTFVLLFSDFIAIIPIPAMAAVIILVGVNMMKWEDVRPHFSNKPETIIFLAAFLSVHIFGLFGAVITGSTLALLHFKWRKLHPTVFLSDSGEIIIHDSLYYGSIPHLEVFIHKMQSEGKEIIINLSDTSYVDAEGERWLELLKKSTDITIKYGD